MGGAASEQRGRRSTAPLLPTRRQVQLRKELLGTALHHLDPHSCLGVVFVDMGACVRALRARVLTHMYRRKSLFTCFLVVKSEHQFYMFTHVSRLILSHRGGNELLQYFSK